MVFCWLARSAERTPLGTLAALEVQLERVLAEVGGVAVSNAHGGQMATVGPYDASQGRQSFAQNWEFSKILENEKSRLRGVLEALGPAGWYGFVPWRMLGYTTYNQCIQVLETTIRCMSQVTRHTSPWCFRFSFGGEVARVR